MVYLDGILTALDVSGHAGLKYLSVRELVGIASLNSLKCSDCSLRLVSPPPEIVQLGGKAVMEYLRLADPLKGGEFNEELPLIVIGSGESGKTSVINALKDGKAQKIHEDKRTVGVDKSVLECSSSGKGLSFQVLDLAGQVGYLRSFVFAHLASASGTWSCHVLFKNLLT